MNPPARHELEWTPERVARFWDEAPGEDYFSAQVGVSLANWIERRAKPNGLVVDVGCGAGDLLVELSRRGHAVLGIDVSSQNLATAATRLDGRVRKGTATNTGLEDGEAATVLLVETIEHLLDIRPALVELRRILRPGGTLVVTTPNNENLERSKLTCPECGARFHKVQHVRAWTSDALSEALREVGFASVLTAEVQLVPGRGPVRVYRDFKARLRRERQHLLAAATK